MSKIFFLLPDSVIKFFKKLSSIKSVFIGIILIVIKIIIMENTRKTRISEPANPEQIKNFTNNQNY